MSTYIGIDLGTSGVKLLLVTGDGRILSECTRHYPCLHPKEGRSEQDAQMWYVETLAGLAQLLEGQDRSLVRGIAAAGQMHGLVTLDKEGNLIRPAILWNDGRAQAQTEYLNGIVGKSELSRLTGNVAFAGFTAPKLMWMREHERKNFARISRIMLPKDYLVYRLCGEFSTDCSDAGGTCSVFTLVLPDGMTTNISSANLVFLSSVYEQGVITGGNFVESGVTPDIPLGREYFYDDAALVAAIHAAK